MNLNEHLSSFNVDGLMGLFRHVDIHVPKQARRAELIAALTSYLLSTPGLQAQWNFPKF